ncbi:amidohydrolase family protein [Candidatus Micrarchaeota archaeon]|nr:amidohydrolase family protein [Candidatus Micrarchaeota archaeon]
MSLVIKNGTAFVNSHFEKKDIKIEGGAITQVGNGLDAERKIYADHMLVLPGLIDPHVHLREPGDTQKEDFRTGTMAAISGGFTTVMDMPNNSLPTVTKERLEEKRRLAEEKALCDVLFHFGGTDSNFQEVKKADPVSMKLYLGKTTGELMLDNPSSLERHFQEFPAERPVVVHAAGDSPDPEKNLEQTYERTEGVVSLAIQKRRRVHIAHATTEKEVLLKTRCPKCTVEVTPHHLFLSSRDTEKLGMFSKVYPPLRPEQKRIYLWKALERVECIATDHAPHTVEDKENGAAGFPGLETSLSLMLTACSRGLLDKIWVAQRMTEGVARAFNIKNKGKLEKGYAGDVTIVDLKKEWEVDGSRLYTKCKWSPFEGKKLKGKAHTVIKDGKVVFSDFSFD